MGWDLLIAIGFIAAIAGLAYFAGRRLALSVYQSRPLLLAEVIVFALVFAFGLYDRVNWATAFPTPAAICWSNWMPIFLALIAGLASELSSIGSSRRKAVSNLMVLLAFVFLAYPVVRPTLFPITIPSEGHWDDGVCMQSHEASCGPAAAATLLHQKSLQSALHLRFLDGQWAVAPSRTAEKRLADACLTSSHGTSTLGLIRGLRIAVADTPCSVVVADSNPAMWQPRRQLPNICVVRYPDQVTSSTTPVRRLLGRDGEGHAIVVAGLNETGKWRIADPAVGWYLMSDQEFRRIFTGEAIYLSDRTVGSDLIACQLSSPALKNFEN